MRNKEQERRIRERLADYRESLTLMTENELVMHLRAGIRACARSAAMGHVGLPQIGRIMLRLTACEIARRRILHREVIFGGRPTYDQLDLKYVHSLWSLCMEDRECGLYQAMREAGNA